MLFRSILYLQLIACLCGLGNNVRNILQSLGVGNLIDRIRTGVVVDYLNCLFINFPVFNFADVCICVGVGLLVLSLLLDMRREQKAKQQKGSAPTDGTA